MSSGRRTSDVDPATGAIDVHVHHSPPSFRQALRRADPRTAARFGSLVDFGPGLESVDALLAGMDDAEVALALVSAPPPAAELGGSAGAATLARAMNDELLAVAGRHPNRLRVLLTTPLSAVDAAADEVVRLGGHPLVAGVCALAHHRERTLDEARFASFWRAAAALGLPVQLHPAFEEPPPALRDWALPTSLDAVFSTSVVTARLILSGLLDREPDLVLVVPHLGGALPYLAQRLSDQSGRGDAEHDITYYLRERVLLDTCSYHPPALRCAVDTVGTDRLLLGSDYPFRGPISRATTDVEIADLSAGEKRRVLRDNAMSLFGLGQAASARPDAALGGAAEGPSGASPE